MISTELIEDDAVDPPFFATLAVQATTILILFFQAPNFQTLMLARQTQQTDSHNQTHTTTSTHDQYNRRITEQSLHRSTMVTGLLVD